MQHSNVTKCLTRSYKEAGMFDSDDKDTRVSPSRIRVSIATYHSSSGKDIDNFASAFMKHRTDTSKINYIVCMSQQESIRLSMKCLNANNEEEMESLENNACQIENDILLSYDVLLAFAKKHLYVEDAQFTTALADYKGEVFEDSEGKKAWGNQPVQYMMLTIPKERNAAITMWRE